jgi:FAD/FMN-containing dehydrogenase
MSHTIAPVLGEATIQELRESVAGEIVLPEDEAYADASRVWNGAHDDARPALIARCASATDVIAAVGFARSHGLTVAVRGGGHSIAGFSTCEGGMVVDLSLMNDVQVDPDTRRASAGGGALWGDVDPATIAHGLVTTGGLISTTGIAGLTLGGGIGWTMRSFGLACDNLVAADVVTADGRLVHASETEHPELLWGLRGGGGNFGIVTRFEYALHPMKAEIYGGPIFYPGDAASDLLRVFADWAGDAPDEITAVVNLTTAPPLPVIPEEWHGKKVAALLAASTGPVDEGAALVSRIREVAEPIADLLGPIPYVGLQTLLDPLFPKGVRAYFKAANLARLDDALIERLCRLHQATPGPQCEIHVHQMGGAVGRVPDGATAFPERSMPFVLNAVATWQDPSDDMAHREWARAVVDAASDASTGRAYVNYLGDSDAARSAYGDETYSRLESLKSTYDPTNVFRLNQNIKPVASSA